MTRLISKIILQDVTYSIAQYEDGTYHVNYRRGAERFQGIDTSFDNINDAVGAIYHHSRTEADRLNGMQNAE